MQSQQEQAAGEDARTIIDICRRFGDSELIKFINEYSSTDKVEMLFDAGHGTHLINWFKETYPSEFDYREKAEKAHNKRLAEERDIYAGWARDAM